MKRREFLAAAGMGAATVIGAQASLARGAEGEEKAEKKAEEKRSQVYVCEQCGTIVEVLMPGEAPLVHCGEEMKLLEELTEGDLAPKHKPVIERVVGGYKVTVGDVEHPMTPAHWIVWIELMADGRVYRQYLSADDKPVATFRIGTAKDVVAREYCNLHGLWKADA